MTLKVSYLFCAFLIIFHVKALPYNEDARLLHPYIKTADVIIPNEELATTFWQNLAYATLEGFIKQKENKNMAKNVIFFLGDGMSIPTLAAARIYKGQLDGKTGENSQLSFEKFPVTGLAKTYCVDSSVADSACSVTAYLCGVKTRSGMIGVNANVTRGSCEDMVDTSKHVYSIAQKFIDKGRHAGFVTTARVTDATPAGVYAHIADRDWENDAEVINGGGDAKKCKDIAHQLIYGDTGKELKVIMGGGKEHFLPVDEVDEDGNKGKRTDKVNLIKKWKETKKNFTHEYVYNKKQLLSVGNDTEYLLGLFASEHCNYHLESNSATDPTLEEMTEAAIKILQKAEKGYFLLVEGARIDHGHHGSYAKIALDETVEFSKAVEKALKMTNEEDTLIIVTADHAHTMSFSGYPDRGKNIFSVTGYLANDKKPYTTLNYANGPGYREEAPQNGRLDPTADPTYNTTFYRHPALVPLSSETHGGDDVAVFAHGPWERLFTGMYEQNVIPYILAYVSCVDPDEKMCNSAIDSKASVTVVLLLNLFLWLWYH